MAIKQFQCKDEGKNVVINLDGKVVSVPWQAALDISRAIHIKAKKAEEFDNVNKIIFDHALLTRVGSMIGLSNDPKIKEEVKKESVWNKMLRRYVKGHKGRFVVGTPTLIRGKI